MDTAWRLEGILTDQVGKLLARPRLYCNIDGLGELGGSLMCLGCALLLWVLMQAPADSVWHRISFLVFAALGLLIHYGTKTVKTRITYPRTGFVKYRRQWHTSAITAAGGALTAAGLAVAFRRHWDVAMLVPLAGLVFTAVYGYSFARAVRWKWVIAGAMAIASIGIAILPAGVLGRLGSESPVAHPGRAEFLGIILLSLMFYGAMLLISGVISFWLYLRHTQAPVQEGQ